MSYDDKVAVEEQWQRTYENSAEARRAVLVNDDGDITTSTVVGSSQAIDVNVVKSVVAPGATAVTSIEFQEVSSVPTSTETTVLTFTNTGTDMYLDHIGGTGSARSEWFVYINTVKKMKRRISVATPYIEIPMYNFKLANGDVIDIKVEHPESATQDFQAEVHYNR